jgi:hypothetical protein
MSNAQQALSPQNEEPLIIYATREFDGYTYQLDPLSEDRVRKENTRYARPQKMPRIFISYDMKEDFEKLVGPFVDELVLEAKDVLEMGGVEFRDPGTDRPLFIWPQGRS